MLRVMSSTTPSLRCASCGQRIKATRTPGVFTHASRSVAACDLNADHRPEPDSVALGTPPCRTCGGPVAWRDGAFAHVAAGVDHPPDPVLPLG